MPRTAQPLGARRRQRLHMAAAEEFLIHGYERASLNRIIGMAGIAKSSFYHYFDDKRALYADLVAHLERTVRDGLRVPDVGVLTVDEFWPAVEAMIADLARVLDEAPELAAVARILYGTSTTSPSPELSRLLGEARAWMAQAIAHGQGVGAVRRDLPPDLLAGIAMATFVELDRWALERYEDPLTAGTADTAVQMLCAMLRGLVR